MKPIPRQLMAVGLALVSLSALVFIPQVSATRPTSALVEALNGSVRMRSREDGQSTAVRTSDELPINTILQVPGTRRGSTEHWIHLRFRSGSRSLTLVQAGTDSADTEYRFPCQYQQGTGLWGLRQVGSNACERITVNGRGWRSQHDSPAVAQNPISQIWRYLKTGTPTSIAQQTPDQLTVTPANTLTLIYIYQTAEGVVINVLTGSATIRSAAGSTIVRDGIQYIDSGNGRRGRTDPIPQEVYSARAVEIFLDPNNWATDTGREIVEFQDAVARQRNESSPQPNDPSPIFIPPSPTPNPSRPPVRDPIPELPSDDPPDSVPSQEPTDSDDSATPVPAPNPIFDDFITPQREPIVR
jgi:hypothetical protein